jgi:hypothetical protein
MSSLLGFVYSPQSKLELLKLACVIFSVFGRDDERLPDFIEEGRALLSIQN